MSSESLASQDCRTCRTRRIKCDRHLPTCVKCARRDFKCPGYGPRLKWVDGVASRGKLKGQPAPVLEPGNSSSPQIDSEDVSYSGFEEAPNLNSNHTESVSSDFSGIQRLQETNPADQLPVADTRLLRTPNQDLTLPLPLGLQNPTIYRLLDHYNQVVASQLAWVDTKENPWRRILVPLAFESPLLLFSILALTSADLSQRLNDDTHIVRSAEHHRLSIEFRQKAMVILSKKLENERLHAENNSLVMTSPPSTNQILAAIIVLCNLEMKHPESALYRLHLKAARTMIRRWDNTLHHLPQPEDKTSLFLLHEFYTTHVWSSLTVFDPNEMTRDILVSDSDAIFIEFLRVVQDITVLIRQRLDMLSKPPSSSVSSNSQSMSTVTGSEIHTGVHPFTLAPIDFETLFSRFETAKSRTLCLSRTLNFTSDAARRHFVHLVSIFHQSGLLYTYRIPFACSTPDALDILRHRIATARQELFNHLHALTDITLFAQDLVWPLMIAGTESVGKPEDQAWVENKMIEVMRASGFMDRQRVLLFLKTFWRLGEGLERKEMGDREVSWVEMARDWAEKGVSFLVL